MDIFLKMFLNENLDIYITVRFLQFKILRPKMFNEIHKNQFKYYNLKTIFGTHYIMLQGWLLERGVLTLRRFELECNIFDLVLKFKCLYQ